MLQRVIPATGELLPVIGMGTWQTFDVSNGEAYTRLSAVLQLLHTFGCSLLDSSPMYGNAEKAVGDITAEMPTVDDFFYATKVWTRGLQQGINQIDASFIKMQRTVIDLLQIHNLLDWQTHLPTLRSLKEAGRIRYIGITHYTDDSHEALIKVLRAEPIDFVQFNYSILSRHAERQLLSVAAERGVATLINRPFGEGKLFAKVEHQPLPGWAIEAGMNSWAAFFLQYIIAHPAVTCVIPATGNLAHAAENLQAGTGALPDEQLRQRMVNYLENL